MSAKRYRSISLLCRRFGCACCTSLLFSRDRRRILHFNVTQHPTAVWAAQQIIEAFPEDRAPRFMVRDRDGIYGDSFTSRVEGMGIEEILIAPRSPWQNCYVERVIG